MSLLEVFADLAELTRNRPVDEDRQSELRVHSSREHFHTYLQSLDADRGGLPEQFRERLRRVLLHYGVDSLDRTPELEAAVFRIFLAQQRTTPEVALVSALLGSWSRETPPVGELAGRARALLERLGRVPQSRYPGVGDLARSVRFRWFDQPAVDAERSEVLLGVRDEIAALAASADAPDRARRIEALAAIPEQTVGFLCRAARRRASRTGEPMLEVLARRHYREYDLHDVRVVRPRARRSATGRGRELHPRRAADPAGVLDRHGGRAGRRLRPRHLGGVARRRSRGARGGGGRPLPLLARRPVGG